MTTLNIMAKPEGQSAWNAWQDDQLVASVASFDEAKERAERLGFVLRIQEDAWMQMQSEGKAPDTLPDDVLIFT